MKVVVAMNEFKSSASAMDMGNACKEGILKVYSDAEVTVLPMAATTYGVGELIKDALKKGYNNIFLFYKTL